jgi:hypothetical protein
VRVFGRMRPEQRTTAEETIDTRVDVIHPDRMIICDWPTTLRSVASLLVIKRVNIECGRKRVKIVAIAMRE